MENLVTPSAVIQRQVRRDGSEPIGGLGCPKSAAGCGVVAQESAGAGDRFDKACLSIFHRRSLDVPAMMRQIEIGLEPFTVAVQTENGDGHSVREACSGRCKGNEGP
jgi:hypothetical protein